MNEMSMAESFSPGRKEFFVPFCIHSAGIHDYKRGESESPTGFLNTYVQLIWCLSGIGEVVLYNKTYLLTPGDVFWYLPGESHCYRAISENWTHYWVCFEGARAADFMLSYGYPRQIRGAGNCPENIFGDIFRYLAVRDLFQLRMNIARIAEILALAGKNLSSGDSKTALSEKCMRFIRNSFQDPSLDINSLCDRFGVHRATLFRAFKGAAHRSPGEYLLAVRASHGMSLLHATDLSVSEVAEACGVPNPHRFSRIIRQITGVTPLEYRKNSRKTDGPTQTNDETKDLFTFE